MKTKSFFILSLTLFISSLVNAQTPESIIADKRAQNIFVELGGQGLLFTANYDSRFSKRRDGLGGRIGIGHIGENGDRATTVPISLNYLLGKEKHFFEMGLGASLMLIGGNGDSLLFDEDNSTVLGTMSFAYRLQPSDRGFSFRAGLSPIFNTNFFTPYYIGVSLGYSF